MMANEISIRIDRALGIWAGHGKRHYLKHRMANSIVNICSLRMRHLIEKRSTKEGDLSGLRRTKAEAMKTMDLWALDGTNSPGDTAVSRPVMVVSRPSVWDRLS